MNTELSDLLKKRPRDAHKGTFGKLLLYCGSETMPGAAILPLRAALRSGAGLCTLACRKNLIKMVAPAVPEAVFFLPKTKKQLSAAVKKSSAVLIGCGMGTDDDARDTLLTVLAAAECPIVVDADGLNLLAGRIDYIKKTSSAVLTPHIGEMARLTGLPPATIKADREGVATAFAREYGVTVVLKDHMTVVAGPDGSMFLNDKFGNPGMAKPGCGDTLAGILGAFLAEGLPPFDAACAAVEVHARAGDLAATTHSEYGMLPSDLVENLCGVFLELGL